MPSAYEVYWEWISEELYSELKDVNLDYKKEIVRAQAETCKTPSHQLRNPPFENDSSFGGADAILPLPATADAPLVFGTPEIKLDNIDPLILLKEELPACFDTDDKSLAGINVMLDSYDWSWDPAFLQTLDISYVNDTLEDDSADGSRSSQFLPAEDLVLLISKEHNYCAKL